MPCLHRAACYDYRRNIKPHCRQIASGYDIIAGSHHCQSVKIVDLGHELDGHADDISADLLIFHLFDTVSNITACSRYAEFHRDPACRPYALLYRLSDLPEVRRSWRAFHI